MSAPRSTLAPAALAIALLVSSCSGIRKESTTDGSDLLSLASQGPVLTDEKVERLRTIADDPSSQLAYEEGPVDESDEPPTGSPAPADPVKEWGGGDWNPRAIHVGDIFHEHSGPMLHKSLSLGDVLPADQWKAVLSSVASVSPRRVPMTLSMAELQEIEATVPPGTALPSRSVAYDFRTIEVDADPAQLAVLFNRLAGNDGVQAGSPAIRDHFASIRKRLEKGKPLFVITAVTRTDFVDASYPGAPIGSRDVDPVLNAFAATYPHLDRLDAAKHDRGVRITRDPAIYWEFDIRELKLDGGRFVIEEEVAVASPDS